MKNFEKRQFTHFSKNPDLSDDDLTVVASAPDSKPERGFWFSDETDFGWSQWCKGESWRLDDLKYAYPVSLDSDARIADLNSVRSIRTFHSKYAYSILETPLVVWIDWLKVARAYDAVIISPYQWKLRLDLKLAWYYGWDCASGVALTPDIVKLGTPQKGATP